MDSDSDDRRAVSGTTWLPLGYAISPARTVRAGRWVNWPDRLGASCVIVETRANENPSRVVRRSMRCCALPVINVENDHVFPAHPGVGACPGGAGIARHPLCGPRRRAGPERQRAAAARRPQRRFRGPRARTEARRRPQRAQPARRDGAADRAQEERTRHRQCHARGRRRRQSGGRERCHAVDGGSLRGSGADRRDAPAPGVPMSTPSTASRRTR